MQRLESKKPRTRSASTRRRSKVARELLNIIEEPSERASKPRLTENFIVNDEFSTRTFQTNFDSTDLSKVKKRNSILNQLNVAPSTTSSRKSLGPLLDMELSRHASFTGLAVPQSQIAPSTFKAQIQVQSTDLAIAQAKLFAEACAQAMAKADEIAQIEADAQLTYVPPDFHENIQQSLNIQRSRSTSKSKTKMENQRRLPVLPLQKPRKESQPMFSNRSKSHEHRKVAFSLNQSAIEHQQQPTTTINSINSNKENKKSFDVVEKLLIREQLLKKQQELLAQDRLSKQQQQIQKKLNQDFNNKRSSLCSTNNYIY